MNPTLKIIPRAFSPRTSTASKKQTAINAVRYYRPDEHWIVGLLKSAFTGGLRELRLYRLREQQVKQITIFLNTLADQLERNEPKYHDATGSEIISIGEFVAYKQGTERLRFTVGGNDVELGQFNDWADLLDYVKGALTKHQARRITIDKQSEEPPMPKPLPYPQYINSTFEPTAKTTTPSNLPLAQVERDETFLTERSATFAKFISNPYEVGKYKANLIGGNFLFCDHIQRHHYLDLIQDYIVAIPLADRPVQLDKLLLGEEAIHFIRDCTRSTTLSVRHKAQQISACFLVNQVDKVLHSFTSMPANGSDLSEIDFTKIPRATIFSQISGTKRDINFSESNLTDFVITSSFGGFDELYGLNFNHANLTNATFKNLSISNCNFLNATLIGTKFLSCLFHRCNFKQCTLSIDSVNLELLMAIPIVDFADLKLVGNTQNKWPHLNFPTWSAEKLDRYLNHQANPVSGSLVQRIDMLHFRYADLKINFMHQLVDSLAKSGCDTGSVHRPMMDICLRNADYINDPKIANFFFARVIFQANGSLLDPSTSTEALRSLLGITSNQCADFAYQMNSYSIPTFMLKNNGFFVQLMALCAGYPVDDIRTQAERLYDIYLNSNELSKINEDGLKKTHYIENGLKDISAEDDSSNVLIFLHRDIKKIDAQSDRSDPPYENSVVNAVMMNRKSLHSKLLAKLGSFGGNMESYATDDVSYVQEKRHGADTHAFRRVINRKVTIAGSEKTRELMPLFSLFSVSYQKVMSQNHFSSCLALLKLNYNQAIIDASHREMAEFSEVKQRDLSQCFDYSALFVEVLEVSRVSDPKKKLTDEVHEFRLTQIFNSVYQDQKSLFTANTTTGSYETVARKFKQQYLSDLFDVFNVSNRSVREKAQTLLSLAAIFCYYSSSYIFGSETDSPLPLRIYAASLIDQAYQLDSSSFGDNHESKYKDWSTRLLGGEDAFTCTAVLTTMIKEEIKKDSEFDLIYNLMKPLEW